MMKTILSGNNQKILVPTTQWQGIHPSGLRCASDAYYARLSTRIAGVIKNFTDDSNEIPTDIIKSAAIDAAAYLEDKINGINLWNAFMTMYQEQCGHIFPFYHTDKDEPYADEPNLNDIRFLLWRRINISGNGSYIHPLDRAIEQMAEKVYEILQSEYESAPDSPELYKAIYTASIYDDTIAFRKICAWLTSEAYLTCIQNKELCFNRIYDQFEEYYNDTATKEMLSYATWAYLYMSTRIGPMAVTAPTWIGKMLELSADDELRDLAPRTAECKSMVLMPFVIKSVDDEKFEVETINGKNLEVSYDTLGDTHIKNIKCGSIICCTMFRYNGFWHVNGISSYSDNTEEYEMAVKNLKREKEECKNMYETLIGKNNGSPIGYAYDWKELDATLDLGYSDMQNTKNRNNEMFSARNILYFINTDGNITLLPDRAMTVAVPDNRLYDKEYARMCGAAVILYDPSSKELRKYLLDNKLIPDARLDGALDGKEEKKWFAENAEFLNILFHTDEVESNLP